MAVRLRAIDQFGQVIDVFVSPRRDAAAARRFFQRAIGHIEADHGRFKSRLHPMRGLEQGRNARIVIAGQGFVQNLRRGHYELAVEEPVARRLAVAFDELALAI